MNESPKLKKKYIKLGGNSPKKSYSPQKANELKLRNSQHKASESRKTEMNFEQVSNMVNERAGKKPKKEIRQAAAIPQEERTSFAIINPNERSRLSKSSEGNRQKIQNNIMRERLYMKPSEMEFSS